MSCDTLQRPVVACCGDGRTLAGSSAKLAATVGDRISLAGRDVARLVASLGSWLIKIVKMRK